jgi:hypothetical protein
LLGSLRRGADRTIEFVTLRLAMLRSWLRTTLAGIGTALAARRVVLAARLAQLKQTILQDGEWQQATGLDSNESRPSSAAVKLPGGDDPRM